MGILGNIFAKEEENNNTTSQVQQSTFENITIKSTNIEKDLHKIANKYNVNIQELDFTIIAYRTYYRLSKTEKFRPLNDIDIEEVLSKENLLKPEFELRQQYKINVYKKNNGFALKIQLGANKDFTKIYATIKKNTSIAYHDRIANDIIAQINKKKIRQGILIGIMDDILRAEVNKVVSHLMINKAILEDIRILVCNGIDRYEEQKEVVNLLFKERKMDESRTTSFKQQSNLSTVKEGEVVIEVIKAQKGQNGRNCRGEFLPMKNFAPKSEILYENLKLSDNFITEEDEHSIKIIAKKDGYIIQKGNNFDISDDIVVEQVNLRTTGSIMAKDKDIKVNIENHDETIDAIASGIVLDTKEVKAKGNVGSNAKISAKLIEINGQTHQTSRIYGKKVKVNLHKGYIDADKVEINILEGGRVVCDEIHINTFAGGKVKAKKIYVGRVISNSTIMASESIEIGQIDGNTNKIIIDPTVERGYDTTVSNLKKNIEKLQFDIEKQIKELKIIKRKILAEQDTITEIKKKIIDFKKRGTPIPAVMKNKLKDDNEKKIKFNKIVAYVKDLKNQMAELNEKLDKFNEAIFDAYVLLKSPWKEYNEVVFKIINPRKDISRMMSEGERTSKLGLKSVKEDKYIIANID